MARLRQLFHRLYNVLRPGRSEPDLEREVASHLSLLEEEFQRRGMMPEDARLAARRAFGGVEQAKELHRDARSILWLDDARRDVRYAAQLLRRTPVFALTATLSLAIGIGATTTIFTVANTLLLRAPAGVADPDRLVELYHTDDASRLVAPVVPYSIYRDIAPLATTLDGVYAYQLDVQPVSVRVAGGAERAFADIVTANYFAVLGVPAAAGRVFGAREGEGEHVTPPGSQAPKADRTQPEPVVVLSHRFWTRRFHADPAIVGQTLWLNSRSFTVVGVASDGFRGTSVVAPDVWVPAGATEMLTPGASLSWMQVMVGARLKAGVSRRQAAAEIDVFGRTIYGKHPRLFERLGGGAPVQARPRLRLAGASPIPGNLRGLVAGFLALLMGLVSMVLVIACANLAGVMLARGSARRLEIAVRLAIGAGRARLIRQLLTETLLLFVLGGAAGLLLARWMTSLLVARLLPAFPVPVSLSLPLDGRVVAFTTGLSLIAALLAGLAPALQASKADVVSALKDETQGPADRLRLRNAFVVAQVAFSILLVVAAGLLGRALDRVSVTDRGLDPRGVELASLDLSIAGYTEATGPAFARALVERVRDLPGVQAATVADQAPRPGVTRGMLGDTLTVPGVTPPNGQPFMASWTIVEPGYFAALRIPIVAGRDFSPADRAGEPAVVIIPEVTARQLWAGQNAVGKYVLSQNPFRPNGPTGPALPPRSLLVIGVVKDLKSNAPRGETSRLAVYAPLQQRYSPHLTIIARSADGRRLANDIRALVQSMDPNLAILAARTLEEEMTGPVETQLRVAASVSGSVGIVSLLLAAIGIYGVTAYVASRRTREIGIRLALGARRADVLGMILRQGMALVAIGSAIGLMLAAAGSRLLTRLLFGVPPLDPLTFGGAAALFAVIGLAACYLPARRATRIDPVVALRYG
jgi:predicted permease